MSKRNSKSSDDCACGADKKYAACCEPLHHGAPAVDAEALMRSRYSAFVLGLPDYIQHSWHSSTRASSMPDEHESQKPNWLGLRIHRHHVIDADHAIVEFTARYKVGGRAFVLHETSRFVREAGHWFYVDGDIDGR